MSHAEAKAVTESTEERRNRITVKILNEDTGMRTIEDIEAVRIHSHGYTLLIMADYAPAIGGIDGDVTIVTHEGEISYPNIKGFFKHQRNCFSLLIDKEFEGWYTKK